MILAVTGQKGGVGKTTTAVNVGFALARQYQLRTLIVDLDSQGQVAMFLGHPPSPGLYDALISNRPIAQMALTARSDTMAIPLWFLASDEHTAVAKEIMAGRPFKERILAKALGGLPYDIIILDCAPSLDVLNVAALVAATHVLVVTKVDSASVVGAIKVVASMLEVAEAGYSPRLIGVLPTMYDQVTRESLLQMRFLVEHFGQAVWPAIPADTKLRAAFAYGKTIWEYAPNSRGAIGYRINSRQVGGYQDTVGRIAAIWRSEHEQEEEQWQTRVVRDQTA